VIPERYPLTEGTLADPAERTELNVRDSDATLVLWSGEGTDGTVLTIECARRYNRPLLIMDPARFDAECFREWVAAHAPRVLNIAGPRESSTPGIYRAAHRLLMELFTTPLTTASNRSRDEAE